MSYPSFPRCSHSAFSLPQIVVTGAIVHCLYFLTARPRKLSLNLLVQTLP